MKDTVYRDDAIKAMEQRYEDILRIFKRKVKVGEKAIALDLIGCVKTLPSADRPQGEWIEHKWAEEVEGLLISNYECSECHSWERCASDFCPNCGASMKGADDET